MQTTTESGLTGGCTMGCTYNLVGALTEASGRVVKNVLDNNGELSIVKSLAMGVNKL